MIARGYYSNGRSAQRYEADIHVKSGDLVFSIPDQAICETWSGAGLKLLEEVYAGKPMRLAHDDYPDAVITVDSTIFTTALLHAHPRLGHRLVRGATSSRVVVWSAITVAVIGGLVFGAPKLAEMLAPHVPPDWETKVGERIVSKLIDGETACDAAGGIDSLQTLTDELIRSSGYNGAVVLYVIDDPLINAYAGPGGHVVIFRGLIDAAESGEQVAGVLAHELAHTVEHHPMKSIARQMALRFVIALLIGDISELSMVAAELGSALLGSTYNREMEAEADALAVALLNRAGYNADGLASLFELLDEQEEGTMPDLLTWFSSHPVHEERVAAVRAADNGGRPALTGSAWQAVLEVCGAPAG